MRQYKFFALFMVLTPFIVITLFVAFMLFGKIVYMNIEYPTYKDVQIKTAQRHNAKILILGDSRAKAGFIPQNDSHLNLAIGGTTPLSGYYTLKRYLAHNAPPKILILSYMSLHYMQEDTFWVRAIKFDYLGFREFDEIMQNARNLGQCKLFSNDSKQCKWHYFFTYKMDLKNFNAEIYNAWRDYRHNHSRYKNNKHIIDSLAQNGGHFFYGRAKESKGLNEETKFKEFTINPLIDLYLRKIMDLAKAHNIIVFHYQMPFNQSSFEALDLRFVREYNAFLDSMQDKYEIISLNNIWALPNSDFGDSSHLFNGAPKTTKDILGKIKAWEAKMRQ